MGGGDCRDNPYNCADAANPLPAPNTVWLEEMTWMDVRDALKAGKTTVIIPTGGIEPNGPWLVTGKHNYVLHANCEAIARKLGNALCAPIVKFVPEGDIEPQTGHMTSPGTISMREATFRAVLTDVGREPAGARLQDHHPHRRQRRQPEGPADRRRLADREVGRQGDGAAHPGVLHYNVVTSTWRTSGLAAQGPQVDGLHDDPVITLNMFIDDPNSVRYDERVKAGKATIDGVSIADRQGDRPREADRRLPRRPHRRGHQQGHAAKGKATMAQQ